MLYIKVAVIHSKVYIAETTLAIIKYPVFFNMFYPGFLDQYSYYTYYYIPPGKIDWLYSPCLTIFASLHTQTKHMQVFHTLTRQTKNVALSSFYFWEKKDKERNGKAFYDVS